MPEASAASECVQRPSIVDESSVNSYDFELAAESVSFVHSDAEPDGEVDDEGEGADDAVDAKYATAWFQCSGFGLEGQPKYFDGRISSEVAKKYRFCFRVNAWKAAGCDGTAIYDPRKSKQRCNLCSKIKNDCNYQRFAAGPVTSNQSKVGCVIEY